MYKTRHTRIARLAAALLAVANGVAFASPPILASAAADAPAITLGTWWWSFASDTPSLREKRLRWLAANHVNEIYLCCPSLVWGNREAATETLRSFVAAAGRRGIRVALLDGDVSWIQSGDTGFWRTFEAFTNYQARVESDERFYGLHLDIEPHQEEGYWSHEADALSRYWNLVSATIAPQVRSTGHSLEFDTPFWWDEKTVTVGNKKRNLAELVSSVADTVTLMSYRDTAQAIYNCGAGEVPMSLAVGNKLVFGVETYSLEGDYVSFMEESQQIMFEELDKLRAILRENHPGGTFGVAIHDVGHWESLKRWTNPPKRTVLVLN